MEFDDDAFEGSGDGETWRVLGREYDRNPRARLKEEHREMLSLWRHWRQSAGPLGGGGPGHLPDAGGVQDQAAVMLDALELMSAAEAAIRKDRKGDQE